MLGSGFGPVASGAGPALRQTNWFAGNDEFGAA